MKKVLMLLAMLCLLISSSLAFAAKPDTCVLLVASRDMKSEEVIKMVSDAFKSNMGTVCGPEIQTKYQEYWFSKGLMEEGEVTPQVLSEFRDYCGYEKCLYIIENSKTEKNIVTIPDYIRGTSYSEVVTSATVELTCYLIGKDGSGKAKLLKMFNTANSSKSGQGPLKAKKWAFKEAIRNVSKQFNE